MAAETFSLAKLVELEKERKMVNSVNKLNQLLNQHFPISYQGKSLYVRDYTGVKLLEWKDLTVRCEVNLSTIPDIFYKDEKNNEVSILQSEIFNAFIKPKTDSEKERALGKLFREFFQFYIEKISMMYPVARKYSYALINFPQKDVDSAIQSIEKTHHHIEIIKAIDDEVTRIAKPVGIDEMSLDYFKNISKHPSEFSMIKSLRLLKNLLLYENEKLDAAMDLMQNPKKFSEYWQKSASKRREMIVINSVYLLDNHLEIALKNDSFKIFLKDLSSRFAKPLSSHLPGQH